jgi:molybdopterin converting factor small subunit
MRIRVQHFAALAESAGCDEEWLDTPHTGLAALFAQLHARYQFALPMELLKPVCNNQLVAWDQPVYEGDTIAFLPPFSGG